MIVKRILLTLVAIALVTACAGAVVASTTVKSVSLSAGQEASVSCSNGTLDAIGGRPYVVACNATTTTSASTTTSTTTSTTSTTSTTTTTTTTVAPNTTPSSTATSWWVPSTQPIEWQWELDHALSLSSNTDMGYDDTTAAGTPAPNPTMYDIDAFDNPPSTVAALHALGDKVVCYIEVGTAGNYYSAAEEGQTTSYYAQLQADGDLGNKQQGWPEYYLNINAPSTVAIVESMIAHCAASGFDAVETDNDETFQYDTGFTITQAEDVSYLETLANYMHSLGLAWFAKNCDDTGTTSFCDAIEPYADAVITEQCNQYDTCADLGAFLGHKAIFNAEYTDGGNNNSDTVTTADVAFCTYDNANNLNGELFDVNLDGNVRVPCR